jgi:hypothetical protein
MSAFLMRKLDIDILDGLALHGAGPAGPTMVAL